MIRSAGRWLTLAVSCALLTAATAHAQPPPPKPPAPLDSDTPLVTVYDRQLLDDLPTSDNLFTVIETLQPEIVPDRFSGGGLNADQPARIGGFLSSWTQTQYAVDGVPLTDPTGSGEPLLFPELLLWDRVEVGTGLFAPDTNAAGLTIDLHPVAPTDRWTRRVQFSTSHGSLAGVTPTSGAPPVAQLDGWDRVTVVAGGPVVRGRVGTVIGATFAHSAQFSRGSTFSSDASLASAFSHTVFTPNSRDTIRVIGWLQNRDHPLAESVILSKPDASDGDLGLHGQAVWERKNDLAPRISGSYSLRRDTPDYANASSGITNRLTDGPVTSFASLAKSTVQSWSLAARVQPTRNLRERDHHFEIGADATGGRVSSSAFFSGTIGELVNESPARVWVFSSPNTSSLRHDFILGGFVRDQVALTPRLSADAGLRYEWSTGSARDAVNGISWQALLPRGTVRWRLSEHGRSEVFAGYSRSTDRLLLDYLAIGDPAAPTADVYRWDAFAGDGLPLSVRGARVARVGPGTGGDPLFSAIDPELKRPTLDEIAFGLKMRPSESFLWSITGVGRTERDLPALVNTGAPASSYASFTVNDPGGNVLSPDDDQVLTVFNRLPTSFGQDRYLLTTPDRQSASFWGLELALQIKTRALTFWGGATAGIAESSVANRGYGPLENDETILGELYANPNAGQLARGRLFADRAFTGKIGATYQFPAEFRLGVIARYQDGQPFSRVIVFPGLNQGAEPVRAFENGVSRFMFIGTLDIRFQKQFTAGGGRFSAFVDVFNLPGRSNSVEEKIAEGPDVRIPIATQPPRAIDLGIRVVF